MVTGPALGAGGGRASLRAAVPPHTLPRSAVRRLRTPGATAVRSTPPSAAFAAIVDEPGTALHVPGEERHIIADLTAEGGAALRTVAIGGGRPVHRFVVPVPEHFSGTGEVVWSGTVDPARAAQLDVWNPTLRRWEHLDAARGTEGAATLLSGGVTGVHLADGALHLRVLGEDPFADDLPCGRRSHGPGKGLRDPAEYDLALVHLTDTQIAVNRSTWLTDPAERRQWSEVLTEALRWVVAEARARKLVYLGHSGDLIESWYFTPRLPEHVASARAEFAAVSAALEILDDGAFPYGVLPGNHDNLRGADLGAALYNERFGPQRFTELSPRWEGVHYGGPWREGDNSHHIDLVDHEAARLVVVHLGYAPPPEALAWARAQFTRHADRDGILLVHDYLAPSPHPDGRRAARTPEGQRIFEDVVAPSPNVCLVLCGHNHGVGRAVVRDAGGIRGHHVVEMLADYQNYEVGEEAGMTGFLRILQIDAERAELAVSTLSPLLGELDSSPYDAERRYDPGADNFTVPLALRSRSTTLTTDAFLLVDLPGSGG